MSDLIRHKQWTQQTLLRTFLSDNLIYASVVLVLTGRLSNVEATHEKDHKRGSPEPEPEPEPFNSENDLSFSNLELALLCLGIIVLTILLIAVTCVLWRCYKKLGTRNTSIPFRYCNSCERLNTIAFPNHLQSCLCHQILHSNTNFSCKQYTCKCVHHSAFLGSSTNCHDEAGTRCDNISENVHGHRAYSIPHVNAHDLATYFRGSDNGEKRIGGDLPSSMKSIANDTNDFNISAEQPGNNLSMCRPMSNVSHPQLTNNPWLKNVDPALKDLFQLADRSITKQVGKKLVVFLTQEVDFRGQTLVLDNMGISLTVPYGAVPHGMKEHVSLVLNWDLSDNPNMSSDQALVSPVVYCGPHGSKFKRKCELNFKHCAFNQKQIQVLTSETDLTQTKNWAAVTRSTKNKTVSLTQDTCSILVSHFSLYTCILYPDRLNVGKKWIQIAIFSHPLHHQINHYQLRVYFLNKTPCALQWAIQNEEKFGATLCCPEKVFLFDGNQSDMCLSVNYLSDHWEQLDDSNIEKVPFIQIWHGVCPHVSLCFKREDNTSSKELNMQLVFFQHNQTQEREKMTVHMTEQPHQGPPLDDVICKKHEFHFHFQGSNPDFVDNIEAAASFHYIPYELKQKLCLLLNPQESFGNDWRMFASKLGFDSCIRYIQSQNNPMGVLLDRIECEGISLNILQQMLFDIERPDAAEEVSKYVESTSGLRAVENEF